MPKLLSLLSPLLALVGCGKCIPVEFTPEERAWVSAYQPGQQVRFRSNQGRTDVLTARPPTEWHENQDCNVLEAGRYQPIRTTMLLQSGTSYAAQGGTSFSVQAYKIVPDRPAQLTITAAGLQTTSDPPGSPLASLVKLTPEAVTLPGGRSYPQAQRFRNGENGALYTGSSQVRAAWWDRQAGLLRYELASGEVYELE